MAISDADPPAAKYAILTVVSFALVVAIYELLVRRFNAVRILFGMKPMPATPAHRPGEQPSVSRA